MSEEMLAKWRGAARALTQPRTSFALPAHVFLGEAVDVAAFVQNYWEPVLDGRRRVIRPGLSSVNAEGTLRLSPQIAQELDELQQAAHRAQFLYKLAVSPAEEDVMEQGAATLSELTAILEYYYDDGQETVEDVQLERLHDEHAVPTSHDAMALALDDYAALAAPIRDQLNGLAGFSVETIDEARTLASQLRSKSAPKQADTAARDALRLRDQIWTLLYDRIREVRRTARIVFRHHPEILRQATSTYQRRKAAEYRRRQRAAQEQVTAEE